MTIAVIKTGGKQYQVAVGQEVKVEKLAGEQGAAIKFDQVLLIAEDDGSTVEVGDPIIKDKAVEAEIVEQGRGKKLVGVKYRHKTRYRRKLGHRQDYTKVKITKI